MAKFLEMFLEQLSRFWEFIGTIFVMFWTYRQGGNIHKYDIGGSLQWQKKEIRRLEDISNGNEVLNKKQCKHVLTKLTKVVECVGEMIKLSSEVQEFGVALEELCCITQEFGVVVSECGNPNRSQAIALQINNKETFRKLVSDLKCCWDVIYEIYDPGLHSIMLTVDLDIPTLEEIEDDERVLERLKDGSNSTWKEYLHRRLGDSQLLGGELDGVEVPNVIDSLKPYLLKEIGEGAFGVVCESIWLGFKCATKILRVPHNVMEKQPKEANNILPASQDILLKEAANILPASQDILLREATNILPASQDILLKEATNIFPASHDILLKEATNILPASQVILPKEATNILPDSDDILKVIRKEVGILAGLSHPNLIKFIYCGIGWSMDELCSWPLKVFRKWKRKNGENHENLYLVMEFMDMSLSDMLEKQSKPLSYLVATVIISRCPSQ